MSVSSKPPSLGRVLSYGAVYAFGVATSAATMLLGGDATPDLQGSVGAAVSPPLVASRLTAAHVAAPAAPTAEEPGAPPVRVPIGTVILELVGEREAAAASEPPLAELLAAPIEAAGSVMAFSEPRSADGDVRTAARRERAVALIGSARRRGPRLEAAQIRGVLASHMPTLRRCYERASRRQGFGTEEHLQLDLAISGGTVESARVSGASNPQLEQCVRGAARAWRFPDGRAQVSLPVRLRPQEG